jgi:hypothetical protein
MVSSMNRQPADITDFFECCWQGTLDRQSASWQGSWPRRLASPRVRARLDRDEEPLRGRDALSLRALKRHCAVARLRKVPLSPTWSKSRFRHSFNSLPNPKRCRYSINITLPHRKNSQHPSGLLLRRAAHFISQHPESERPSQTCRWRSQFAGLTKRIESEGRAPDWLGLRQSFADRYVSSTANTTEAMFPSSASRFGLLTSSCYGPLSVGA